MPSPSDEPSSSDEVQKEDRIIQSIYDHVLNSVVVTYASNMHEMIKTGGIATSELGTSFSRPEIYPDLYAGKTPEEVQSILEAYATEEIQNNCHSKKRKLPSTVAAQGDVGEEAKEKEEEDEDDAGDDDDDDDEDFKDDENDVDDDDDEDEKSKGEPTMKKDDAAGMPAAAVHPPEQQPPEVDIWGRIPPKEPKQPVQCTLCGRHISTTRFASHLEKCMGISTRPLPGAPIRNAGTSDSLK